MRGDPVAYEFKTLDHPEANGRKALPGETEYPMTFTSDKDERIIIRMGRRGFETVTNLLVDMLANMPSHDDGSLGPKGDQEPKTQSEAVTLIYLMSGRKQWHHNLPDGWKEAAWERFDYVECGIFQKATSLLTDKDRGWVRSHGVHPRGWINPSRS